MHPVIFELFERICRARGAGGDVLEIGATPTTDTLLRLPCLAAARSRTGLNLDGPHQGDGFTIVAGDANAMTMFAEESFDTVLCNAMLEHDARFWLTLAEIRRVLRPGGLLVIGVPAYLHDRLGERLGDLLAKPATGAAEEAAPPPWLQAATAVLGVHDYPGDYYRFSAQAAASVLMEGMTDVELVPAMEPPRLVASGRRAAPAIAETTAETAAGDRAGQGSGPWSGLDQLAALARELAPLGPPVIVFNRAHSGSRLLARCLAAAGVFMGANRSDSEDALDLVPLVEHIVEFHYPDFTRFFREGDPALPGLVRRAIGSHLGPGRGGAAPAGRWGWKLSETHYALPIIARLFPTARFVHLLRDGRDVAFRDFNAPTTPFLKKIYFGTDRIEQWRGLPLTKAQYREAPHLFNARLWLAAVSDARSNGMMLGERYCEVRYESLVADFAPTLRRLGDFLGLEVPEATLSELARSVRDDAVGRHRAAPPADLNQVLMALGPSLAAFGYGPEAEPERGAGARLSIVLLPPHGSAPAEVAATLADLGRLAALRPEILQASPAGSPGADDGISEAALRQVALRHLALPAGADEVAAAAAGLAAARGDYVLFARPGQRFTADGLERLLRDAEHAGAVAAVGRLLSGAEDGEISMQLANQELLRWADATPLGAVLFRRGWAATQRLAPGAVIEPGTVIENRAATGAEGWWHWALIAAASRADLVIYAHHLIGRSPEPVAIRPVPRPVLDSLAAAPTAPATTPATTPATAEPPALHRIMVYGAAGASTDLLFDGLPEELRRHLRFVPQAERELDLGRLAAASAVLLLRDFQLPLRNGTIDTLVRLGIPFHYVADDHFPTLAQEYDDLSFYTEENVAAMLALAAGAIVTTPPLRDKLAPLAAEVLLWPPVWDASLMPSPDDPATAPVDGCLRFGIMGDMVRSGMLQDRILPALRGLAQERPVELVARAGLIEAENAGLPCVTLPFEPSFRRFIHAWRRRRIDVILHPPAATANAVYKNPNALLVSRYLGAVPVLAAGDPAYRDLPEGCGAILAGPDRTPWPLAVKQIADPATRQRLARELDDYCRSAFPAAPAVAALRRVLERSAPVGEALIAERLARLAAGMPFANRAVNRPRATP